MRSYEANTTIDAAPEQIWPILADGRGYSDWDSGVVRVEGDIAPGEKLKVFSELNPGRGYPIRVTEFAPPRRMMWTGGMPLGVFTGRRTFELEPRTGPRGSGCARSSPAR